METFHEKKGELCVWGFGASNIFLRENTNILNIECFLNKIVTKRDPK